MFVSSLSVTHCIYVLGKPGICFHCNCAVYDECKYSDTFWLADRTCLFVQYTISLSSLCKLIRRHWTYKMPVRYILSSVWIRLSIFSPLSIMHHMGLYVFSLPISLVMIERIHIRCLIIIIKSEVWTITHCLGLGHETIVSAVYLSYSLFASEMPQWFLLNWKFPFRLWRMFDAEIKRGDGYVKYCPISWFAPKSSQRPCWAFIRIDQRHAWHRADLKFRI